jgi:soluble lytic murein transglycosylase-like protein
MNLRILGLSIPLAVVIAWGAPSANAQALYSYIDADGVRVLTNIAPVQPVQGMKVTGTPEPALDASPENTTTYRYDSLIEKYASVYGLDPFLVRSVIATESGFNEKAVSSKGAQGLMQLMPATASRLGVKNSFDPEQNIQGGTKHLRNLLDTFNNDLPLSLAAYNAGENLVQRLGRIPDIKETHDYVRQVTQQYQNQREQETTKVAPMQQLAPAFSFRDTHGILHLTNIPSAEVSMKN